MKRLLYVLPLALVLASAPMSAHESRRIHETEDPYTGVKTLTLEVDTHGCPDDRPLDPYDAQVHLIVTAMQMQPHRVVYLIASELKSRHMKLPDSKNATMDTSIDGVSMQLGPGYPKTKWSQRSAWSGRHVHEMVPFDVSLAYLTQLSQAREFHFRVNARYDSVQRCADAHDLRELHTFLTAAASY